MPKQLLATLIILLWVGVVSPAKCGGFVDFDAYGYLADVDSDNMLTVNIFVKLDERWHYFSLSNFRDSEGGGRFTELDTYYTEQNIRWKTSFTSPVDLTAQSNFRSGSDNDRHRLGFRWRLNDTRQLEDFFQKIHLKYSMNFHLIQFDHEDAD
ncbi:MAG TPA: hypothetical protein EYQ00_02490, partial [Dehalococcoidia bacterium]|nr:hypothetical protein [Dehalococcoidia bacterium]